MSNGSKDSFKIKVNRNANQFMRWDERADGKVFWAYNNDDSERWVSKEYAESHKSKAKPKMSEVERFWSKIKKTEDCWEYLGARNQNGYGRFSRSDGVLMQAHRYSWTLHIGEIPCGLFVCHRCDNPPCCNPNHLFLGTVLDNAADMRAKLRSPIGRRLLTFEQAEQIRKEYIALDPNFNGSALAKKYGVLSDTIYEIVHNRHYLIPERKSHHEAEIMKNLTEVEI